MSSGGVTGREHLASDGPLPVVWGRCAILLAVVWLQAPAWAQAEGAPCSVQRDQKAYLQECRERAQAAEQAGRLEEALRMYRQAYQEVPTPRLLLPMASLHLRLRQPGEGLAALSRYRIEVPQDEVPAAQREEVERLQRGLSLLEEDLRRLAKQPAGAGRVEPGPAVPPPAEPPGARFRVWKWVTLGVGVGLIGAGAGLWTQDGKPSCGLPDGDTQCPMLLSTSAGSAALVSVGAAAIVGGVVMIGLDVRGARAHRHARLSARR